MGYTDAPHTAPFFNYGISLDLKQSPYNLHQPAEQAPTKYERQALAPYGFLGHYNTTSVPAEQAGNRPYTDHLDARQVSGFEHHTSVFNEQVLHCDALKAVELKHSSRLEAGNNGTDASGFGQVPLPNPLQPSLESSSIPHANLDHRGLLPYCERRQGANDTAGVMEGDHKTLPTWSEHHL